MNERTSGCFFVALAALCLNSTLVPANSQVPTDDEQALLSLERGWAHAYLADDAAYLESVMSPSYVQTNVRGEVSTKPEEVAEVRGHAIRYDKFESSDLKVRVFGDAAVVTGQTSIKATVKASGRVIDASIRFTDTFVRQQGTWQAVAGQTTMLPGKP